MCLVPTYLVYFTDVKVVDESRRRLSDEIVSVDESNENSECQEQHELVVQVAGNMSLTGNSSFSASSSSSSSSSSSPSSFSSPSDLCALVPANGKDSETWCEATAIVSDENAGQYCFRRGRYSSKNASSSSRRGRWSMAAKRETGGESVEYEGMNEPWRIDSIEEYIDSDVAESQMLNNLFEIDSEYQITCDELKLVDDMFLKEFEARNDEEDFLVEYTTLNQFIDDTNDDD